MKKTIITVVLIIALLMLNACTNKSNSNIPSNCKTYFDGCNTCGVAEGKIVGCTEKACGLYSEPKCLELN
jgi:uncharacterized lipoprotein NlpE involved in copper resistance